MQRHHLCRCGCGLPTNLATRNRRERGHVKGEPLPYLQGHQEHKVGPPHREPMTADEHADNLLHRRYGIRLTDYRAMHEAQKSLCRICERTRKLVVDHDHESGAVRGLLCRTCNSQLGFLERFGERATAYLKEAYDAANAAKNAA